MHGGGALFLLYKRATAELSETELVFLSPLKDAAHHHRSSQ